MEASEILSKLDEIKKLILSNKSQSMIDEQQALQKERDMFELEKYKFMKTCSQRDSYEKRIDELTLKLSDATKRIDELEHLLHLVCSKL